MTRSILIRVQRFIVALRRPSRATNLRRLRARGENLDDFTIREASASEIPELARLHVVTWNNTYAPFGMVGPAQEIREGQWRTAFAQQDPEWFCFVAEKRDGQLVGFAQANRSDHPAFGGELNKIYLLPEFQRLGLGSRLLGHVARRFLSLGIESMWLYGDARNPSSKAWEKLGAQKTDDDPGNGNYGWRDLTGLASKPE